MEQVIVSTETLNVISSYEAERKANNQNGFIIMVDNFDRTCGIVYPGHDEDCYSWNGQSVDEYNGADTIKDLMDYFPQFNFKLIS